MMNIDRKCFVICGVFMLMFLMTACAPSSIGAGGTGTSSSSADDGGSDDGGAVNIVSSVKGTAR
ncbi:hypothetical protein DID77_04425 [Candidatus Marinamargulisbacteria bacterium SCGC AG-439-L15]|nr:hypothetical protein DID77_04425 [Candidatus Marinamargulisbacteria bacterium SCGC AG-439-L15]